MGVMAAGDELAVVAPEALDRCMCAVVGIDVDVRRVFGLHDDGSVTADHGSSLGRKVWRWHSSIEPKLHMHVVAQSGSKLAVLVVRQARPLQTRTRR